MSLDPMMSVSRTAFPVYLGFLLAIAFGDRAMAQQGPAITTYGDRREAAPEELDLFSFLIGKWEGSGRTRLADGTIAEYDGLTWIGRYVLQFVHPEAGQPQLHRCSRATSLSPRSAF